MKSALRLAIVLLAMAVFVLIFPFSDAAVFGATAPTIAINIDHAAPREIEETTQKAVARDYATAWQAMTAALSQNRIDLLNANFIGTANEKLSATIQEQKKAGLHQRITDQGHAVDAVFYSPEGSAIELHDTAHLRIELLDGGKVVHSQDAAVHYVALLTAAENS